MKEHYFWIFDTGLCLHENWLRCNSFCVPKFAEICRNLGCRTYQLKKVVGFVPSCASFFKKQEFPQTCRLPQRSQKMSKKRKPKARRKSSLPSFPCLPISYSDSALCGYHSPEIYTIRGMCIKWRHLKSWCSSEGGFFEI